MAKRVSIKNIAQKVGASNAAVSLVLNGRDKECRIGKDLAERIRVAAKELNYEPNHLARGLRMGASKIIGLVVADISNPFFAALAFHIQEYAEKFGYSVIITNTNESNEKLEKILNVLYSHQVDGLIVVPTEYGQTAIENIVRKKFPLVLLDRWFPDIPTCHVAIDNYQVSKNAVQYLIDNNCKRIALVSYTVDLPHMQERKRGYVDALQKSKLFQEDLIKDINYISLESNIENALDNLFFNKKNEKPDGIFFATNSITLAGLRYLIKKGVDISNEIKIACFDKSDVFNFMDAPISYILQPISEMGELAVNLLVDQIKKGVTTPSKMELFAKLCLKE